MFFIKLIKDFFARRSLRAEYCLEFSNRNIDDWQKSWEGYDLQKVDEVCSEISYIMMWRSKYFMPQDSLLKVFYNATGDMREVVVVLKLEEMLGISLGDDIYDKTMRDLFAPRS